MLMAAALKQLGSEKGWTQREWAKQAGVTENSLSDYLSGKYPPRMDTLGKLLAAGDWTLLDLAKCMESLSERGEERSKGASVKENPGWDEEEGEAAVDSREKSMTTLRERVMLKMIESSLDRIATLEARVRNLESREKERDGHH